MDTQQKMPYRWQTMLMPGLSAARVWAAVLRSQTTASVPMEEKRVWWTSTSYRPPPARFRPKKKRISEADIFCIPSLVWIIRLF